MYNHWTFDFDTRDCYVHNKCEVCGMLLPYCICLEGESDEEVDEPFIDE
jgi:hypothetical protein